MITCALLMRHVCGDSSRANKEERLPELVAQHEAQPQAVLCLDLEAFYSLGGTFEELTQTYNIIQKDFKFYSTVAGALIGLVVGMALIGLSVKRARKLYEIDHAACVDCGRCFGYCPQNKVESINLSI